MDVINDRLTADRLTADRLTADRLTADRLTADWLTADWLTADWLTADWRTAVAGVPAVLVTVALVQGSGPREPGAKMLVTAAARFDTIGGGHLELRALEIARGMLGGAPGGALGCGSAPGSSACIERFALGPGLGQCCGGVVHLVFEPVDAGLAAVLASLRQRRNQDSWRLAAIDGPARASLFDASGKMLAGADSAVPPWFAGWMQEGGMQEGGMQEGGMQGGGMQGGGMQEGGAHGMRMARMVRDGDGRRWLLDPCLAPRAHLTLFGAGHVGAALVRAMADLPCNITWVDQREDQFPAAAPANVSIEVTDAPEALVVSAPCGGSFLVMTHSHALDQRLAEAIMARDDAGWFGLIGSRTKRKHVEHRLRARGFDPGRIAAMVCPVGLPGITGKAPAVIAASVCAQLLIAWDCHKIQEEI